MEAQTRKFKNSEKGSALIIVAGILAVLSIVVDTAVTNFDVGLNIFTAIHEKKQVFYMTEGVRNIATVLVETFLQTNASPDSQQIQDYINANLPPLIPAPYSISPVTVQKLNFVPNAVLTSGPYQGINGPVTTLEMKFTVKQPSLVVGGSVVQTVDLQLSVAYISMFEFLIFYDNGTAFLQTGPDLNVRGRLHANQDFCVGSDGGYEYILKATVAGRLMATNDARCGYVGISNTKIATDGTFTNFADLQASYDNGCTNCKGTGLPWQAFSIARWHQQALDSANGVVPLVLPGSGLGLTQAAVAGNFAAANNSSNLRFIIDPVLPTDSPTVESYKFSNNADIRIINGVWYLKDPANPYSWPGVPIWSDHPGRFHENTLDVGQDDIRDYWSVSNPWPAAPATPTNYSFYAYDASNTTIIDDPSKTGVISYGNLANTGAVPRRWRPAGWIQAGVSPLCSGGNNIHCGGGNCGLKDVWSNPPPACSGGPNPGDATQLLNATRGGFRNGHIQMNSPQGLAVRTARSMLLPVNFDVDQFQTALANTAPGELGSYFGPGRFKPLGFNGVVYISSVWPGGLNGFGLGGPDEWPYQGAVADNVTPQPGPGQPGATQQALPQPLCSNTNNAMLLKPGLAGQPFDLKGGTTRFRIPDCNNYAAGSPTPITAYPNVVRVINGSQMDNTKLPTGLSIVSNLPVYLMGDYNQLSVQGSATATPWIPALVAGDRVVMISNSWNDANSRWDVDPSGVVRTASSTVYNTAMLTDNLTFFLEDWSNKSMTVNGSMVLGHNYVYSLHTNYCCGNISYQPPNRIFNFDPHFQYITNQPPGTPVFPVSATLNWSNPQ